MCFFCHSMDGNPVKVEDAAPICAETQATVIAAGWVQVDAVGMSVVRNIEGMHAQECAKPLSGLRGFGGFLL